MPDSLRKKFSYCWGIFFWFWETLKKQFSQDFGSLNKKHSLKFGLDKVGDMETIKNNRKIVGKNFYQNSLIF
jgi:hypothetical protein